MDRRVAFLIGVGIIALSSMALAAELYDQDYFRANAEDDTVLSRLLASVEGIHYNRRVIENFRAERYGAVVPNADYVLGRFPNHPKGLMLMGATMRLAGTPEKALPYFERALALSPQYAITHAQYGMFLVDTARAELGVERLEAAVEMDPNLIHAFANLAETCGKLGEPKKARDAASRARALG